MAQVAPSPPPTTAPARVNLVDEIFAAWTTQNTAVHRVNVVATSDPNLVRTVDIDNAVPGSVGMHCTALHFTLLQLSPVG